MSRDRSAHEKKKITAAWCMDLTFKNKDFRAISFHRLIFSAD
jgi:hypothetical protein